MKKVYVRCPECEHYLGSDDQYGCTTCWGSRLIPLEDYEKEEGHPYYGSDFYDEDGDLAQLDDMDEKDDS